ncbi:FK506-binding protein 15 isoform X2 [Ixodes scapularis]|uniref:FK506-binding protein 15 isoform X2 n=1 Tax=Ixodes scapularis TaxID=6945 RepID=UPI001A9CDF88|nr:FK506-binding protein 15 isoform X2 [Ixodes scapularis]
MLLGNDDDDLDFAVQPGSSKLAKLFTDTEAAKADNSSLTYTPPRQPSSKNVDAQNAGSLSLLHATAVQAFKYENGKPVNQGKLGAAILGNHESTLYKLILYKGKQQHIAVAAINQQFIFKAQGNNFLSFLDNERTSWSVKFENEQSSVEFAKQVVLAKANSLGSSLSSFGNIITQDICLGEGEPLDNNGVAVIRYTGWLLSNHSLGKVFDTNADAEKPLKVKLGKGKVIKGWEDGLQGCKQKSRRLLVVPPLLAYGSQGLANTVPSNATLIFDISISKAKSGRDSTRSTTPVSNTGSEAERPETRSLSHSSVDESIRARGASLSEQLSQAASSGAESDKARLLSRMAKMGNQILPLVGAVPARPSSESEPEDEPPALQQTTRPQPALRADSPKPSVKPRSTQPLPAPQPIMQPVIQPMVAQYAGMPHQASAASAAQQMAVYQSQPQFAGGLGAYPYHQQGLVLPPQPYQAAPMAPLSATVPDGQLPLLLSETRSQNTEIRLGLSKVADKVDTVLSKLDSMRPPQAASSMTPYMDSEVLLHNIQRIVQENIKLKEESGEKGNKIQALNEKICDLLQRNQRFMEESNTMLEQRSDSLHSSAAHSQARLHTLEKEKLEVTEKLNEAQSLVSSLKAELSEKQQRDSKMQEQLEELRSHSQEKENILLSLENSLKEARQQKHELEARLAKFEEQVLDLERLKNNLEKNLSERTQKLQDDRKRADEELDDVKMTHEKEIERLQTKLHQLMAAQSSQQVADLEAELRNEWQARCEKQVAEVEKKLGQRLQELEEEKCQLEQKLRKLPSESSLSVTTGSVKELAELGEEVERLRVWKVKYEELSRSKDEAADAYESRIRKLLSENQALKSSGGLANAAFDFDAELKKIMNTLFRLLQREFSCAESYSRSEATSIILETIKYYTTEVLKMRHSKTSTVATGSGDGSSQNPKEGGTESKTSSTKSEVHSEPAAKDTGSAMMAKFSEPPAATEAATEVKTGSADAGSTDAGSTDAGSADAGSADAGSVNAETGDAGNGGAGNGGAGNGGAGNGGAGTGDARNGGADAGDMHPRLEGDSSEVAAAEEKPKQVQEEDAPASGDNAEKSVVNDPKKQPKVEPVPDWEQTKLDELAEDSNKRYVYFHPRTKSWKPQPPPPPLFDDDDDEDDWLK